VRSVSKEEIKKLFRKVHKITFPDNFEQINWSDYFYYAWLDKGNGHFYLLTDIRGKVDAILFNSAKLVPGKKAMCDITHCQTDSDNVVLIVAQKKISGYGNYESNGLYTAADINWVHQQLREKIGIAQMQELLAAQTAGDVTEVQTNPYLSSLINLINRLTN
jgi:hypothetical protein